MALKDVHRGHVPEAPVPAGQEIGTLSVGGTVVARCCDGASLPRVLAPRPFLHPVTTLAGTTVTAAQPDDHRWHLGLSVTLQDVGGVNVWGGRTFVRDEGYVWRDDHGRQLHRGWLRAEPARLEQRLEWHAPDGRLLLSERRTLVATASPDPRGWLLHLSFGLRNEAGAPLALGSPATHGRDGAGYGGLFWRFPALGAGAVVLGPEDRTGEGELHGSRSRWVAVTSAGASDAPFTVALSAADEGTAGDPWFVRLSDYPGLGSQLAATHPVVLQPGDTVRRAFVSLVADGTLSREEIGEILASTVQRQREDR